MDLIRVQFPSVLVVLLIKKIKGTWSSLVYGTRLENEHSKRVVGSNPTVPVLKYNNLLIILQCFI